MRKVSFFSIAASLSPVVTAALFAIIVLSFGDLSHNAAMLSFVWCLVSSVLAAALMVLFGMDHADEVAEVPLSVAVDAYCLVELVIASICIFVAGVPFSVALCLQLVALVLFAVVAGALFGLKRKVSADRRETQARTRFLQDCLYLIEDAERLITFSEPCAVEVNKTLDLLRYSDPVSTEASAATESKITALARDINNAARAGEPDRVIELCAQLRADMEARNRSCVAAK